jgi:hypothetical protein
MQKKWYKSLLEKDIDAVNGAYRMIGSRAVKVLMLIVSNRCRW